MHIEEYIDEWLHPNVPRSKVGLASALGITRPTLEKKLAGESEWTLGELRTIAALTGHTIEELISDAD